MPGSAIDKDAVNVRQHFHKTAHQFDSIYSGKKSTVARALDRLLRWDMQKRLEMTIAGCQPAEGKRILDVGCGTGRFCLPLAQQGAAQVIGIDFAENMIAEAQRLSRAANLDRVCQFQCCDILDYQDDTKFDHVLAIGLFDYIKDG
ncbi:MAG: class I SAM-dependent methyltransferase, partial [bacterium]